MYVVYAEALENSAHAKSHIVQILEQTFARICCRIGLAQTKSFHFAKGR